MSKSLSYGPCVSHLPPTHEPYLPLLPSCKASPPFGYCAYPRRDVQAELTWVAGHRPR